MSVFEWNFEKYEYDESLWQLVKLHKNNAEYYECSHTLKYVGPIVNGDIVGEVPRFPVFVGTFNGLTDLVKLPRKLPKFGLFESFIDCCNFNPTIQSLVEWNRQWGSGSYSINPFSGCNSPHIIDVKQESVSVYEHFAKLFSADVNIVRSKIECIVKTDEKMTLLEMLRNLDRETILKCIDLLDTGDIDHWIFSTGGIIDFTAAISLSSEISDEVQCVCGHHAFTCNSRPIWLDQPGIVWCVRLADDFVVDTDDERLIKEFGRILNNESMNVPYKAGENGCVHVSGNSVIECNNSCPLQASGTLTIVGSGTLTVRSIDRMQACIGTNTHTGMSYGRWEPGWESALKKIIVDGVRVVCESSVPNFTLGNYGESDVPEIECRNGGELICPETTGIRKMIKSGAEGLSGSTKRYNDAIYEIVAEEKGVQKLQAF